MVTSPKPKMWFGQIEDIFDPLEIGRYRVRVHGYNTTDDTILPTEDLQWFPIVTPNNAANRGVGISPTFFDVGTIVLGMYLDDENQNGIILGSAHSYDYGNSDVSGFARGGEMDSQMSFCDKPEITDTPSDTQTYKDNAYTSTDDAKPKNKEQEKIKLESTGSYKIPPKSVADLDKLLTNKNVQIFLSLVRYTEGTEKYGGGVPGCYHVLVGGSKFNDLSRHPNKAIYIKSINDSSTAAGAYQILYRTWKWKGGQFGLSDFGYKNQDRCAVSLLDYRKALKYIIQGNWVQAMKQCRAEWVSLPHSTTKQGNGPKGLQDCLNFIKKRGGQLSAQDNTISQPVNGMNPNVEYDENGNPKYGQITNDMTMSCGTGEDGSQFPISRGNSSYPYNKTMTTNSGHVIEIDDTPNNERINIYHKSGSYLAYQPNGDVFHKSVGNDYTLILEDKNEIISGVQNVTVMGDANLNIGGIWNVKASEANFDIPIIKQAGEYYCNEAIIQGTKFTEHQHKGVTSGGDLSLEPLVDGVMVGSMSVETATFAEIRLSRNDVQRMVRDGLMTQEDADEYHKPPEAEANKETDKAPVQDNKMENSPCGQIPRLSNGRVNMNSKLGKYHNFGYFIGGAAGKKHTFKSMQGLSEAQIYCNMKHLVENCYDRIKDKYPSAMNSSCFRSNSGTQHGRGQAIDITFGSIPKSKYYEIAVWIKNNIPFDQLLLEYRGASSCWIHISIKRSGNRRDVRTLVNDKTYRTYLVKYR